MLANPNLRHVTMSNDLLLVCNKLDLFSVCVLAKSSIEIRFSNRNWSQLLSDKWLDSLDKRYQDQLVQIVTNMSDKLQVMVCPVGKKQVIFHFSPVMDETTESILILAMDITQFIDHGRYNNLYALLLSEILRYPTHDKRLVGNVIAIRKLHSEMTGLIDMSLGDTSRADNGLEQRLGDMKVISEDAQLDTGVLSRQDLRKILEETSMVIGSMAMIEKRFENSVNLIVMVDHGRLVTLLETTLRKIRENIVGPEVSERGGKVLIRAAVLGTEENLVLQMKYMYIGTIMTLQTLEPGHVIISGYMKALKASITSECIGSRVVMTMNIPVVNINEYLAPMERSEMIKVGVADDNPLIRIIVKEFGKTYGHVVFECSHGKDTLEMVRSERPDILFLDMQMPILDGISVIEEVRKWEAENNIKRTSIVGVTGFGDKFTADMILQAGGDASQEKPMTREKYKMYVDIFTQL